MLAHGPVNRTTESERHDPQRRQNALVASVNPTIRINNVSPSEVNPPADDCLGRLLMWPFRDYVPLDASASNSVEAKHADRVVLKLMDLAHETTIGGTNDDLQAVGFCLQS